MAEGHPFATLRAYPQATTAPEIWILGSSNYGAQVAAHFGLPYCFAWFFTDGRGAAEALEIYRTTYRPSARHPAPNAGICVWALAAVDEETAFHHFASRAKWRLFRNRGSLLPLETAEVASAIPYSASERAWLEQSRREAFVGIGGDVAQRVQVLAADLSVQEVAIVTWTHDETVRRRSYELLAEAFELN